MRNFLSLVLAAAALGCRSTIAEPELLVFGERLAACDASADVRAYIQVVADRASGASWTSELARREAATLSVQLTEDGEVARAVVGRATSEAAGAWGLAAVREAAPFPAPEPGVRACVVERSFLIVLVTVGAEEPVCGTESETRYLDAIARAVLAELHRRPERLAPGSGRVDLRIEVTETGELLSASVFRSESDDAGAKALAALHRIAPLPVPPTENARRCVARKPFQIRLELTPG